MSDKCVYEVIVNDKPVLAEANNQAQAIRIATQPLVTGCRPLKAGELLKRMRAGEIVLPVVPEPVTFDPPTEDGKADGETAFMDPDNRNKVTHRWQNGEWLVEVPAAEEKPAELGLEEPPARPEVNHPGPEEKGEIPISESKPPVRANPPPPARRKSRG